MIEFLQQTFRRFTGAFHPTGAEDPALARAIDEAVERLVDATFPRMRAIGGYARRLREPTRSCFAHIDRLVEQVPDAFLCSPTNFGRDPRVNAFFVNANHVREVFSTSEDVRKLFDQEPEAESCYALLCMRKEERRQLGMAMEGGQLRRDVARTAVNFADHQVVSPGASQTDARRALKCCIFHNLLDYLRNRAASVQEQARVLDSQLRLSRVREHAGGGADLAAEIAEVERKLLELEPRLASLEDYLTFVEQTLRNPERYVSGEAYDLTVDRMGIRQETTSSRHNELHLSEIRVGSKPPRIAALVRFPRADLLPRQDFLKKADLFLNVL